MSNGLTGCQLGDRNGGGVGRVMARKESVRLPSLPLARLRVAEEQRPESDHDAVALDQVLFRILSVLHPEACKRNQVRVLPVERGSNQNRDGGDCVRLKPLQGNPQRFNPSFARKLKTFYPDAVTPRDKQQAYPFELLWREGCGMLGMNRADHEKDQYSASRSTRDDHFQPAKTARRTRTRGRDEAPATARALHTSLLELQTPRRGFAADVDSRVFHVCADDEVEWKALPARKIIFFNPPYRSMDATAGKQLAEDEGLHALALFFRCLQHFLKLRSCQVENSSGQESSEDPCFDEVKQVSGSTRLSPHDLSLAQTAFYISRPSLLTASLS
eukprot:755801-Hanusia_phi.AAC.1